LVRSVVRKAKRIGREAGVERSASAHDLLRVVRVEPLVVQTHIPQTGGTALRQLVNANYEHDEVVHTERLGVGPAAVLGSVDPASALVRAWREYYGSLPAAERSRLRCVCGHQAPFVIDAVTDRPVRAFTMLRDPVDRVISSYFFMLQHADRLPPSNPAVRVLAAMRQRGWGLGDVYRELGGAGDYRSKLRELDEPARAQLLAFFNGQIRHLLLPAVTPDDVPPDADGEVLRDCRDKAFAMLSKRYVVGTQDRFSQSVRLFADSFGWRRVFEPRVNVGRLRGRREAEIDQETLSLIRRYNRADAELHAHYSERLRALPPVGRLTDLRARGRRSASRMRAWLELGTARPGRGRAGERAARGGAV